MRRIPFHRAPQHWWKSVIDAFCEGWYVKGDQGSQDRARLLGLNYTSGILTNLIGGTFFTGLLLYMKASDSFIGAMSMVSVAANMLQIFAPILLERFPKRRRILTWTRFGLQTINILFIGLIPLFPVGQQAKLSLVAISVLVVNLLNACIAPGTSIWHIQCVPPHQRNAYFTRVTMTVGAVVAVFNLAGSKWVDICRASGHEFEGLMTLRLIAYALLIVDTIFCMLRIHEQPYEQLGTHFSLKSLLTIPLRQKQYMKTVLVAFMWNFTANLPGPFYQVYLLRDLQVDYSYLMLINLFNVPAVILLTPLWSRLLRKWTWFQMLSMAICGFLLHYLMLSFVTRQTMVLYPIAVVFSFVLSGGINLPMANVPYINMPQENQTIYMGFYSTACNLAALLGVTCGRTLINCTEGLHFTLFGLLITNKQYILWLTAALMAVGAWIIWRADVSVRANQAAETKP